MLKKWPRHTQERGKGKMGEIEKFVKVRELQFDKPTINNIAFLCSSVGISPLLLQNWSIPTKKCSTRFEHNASCFGEKVTTNRFVENEYYRNATTTSTTTSTRYVSSFLFFSSSSGFCLA